MIKRNAMVILSVLLFLVLGFPQTPARLVSARDDSPSGPEDFTLGVTPPDQQICQPADAVYTVQVGQIGGSSDAVTLLTDNLPPGTWAGFSVNPVIPPGTSTLTIGNTGAATAGSYALLITGISATDTHSISAGLYIEDAPPGQTVLYSPANGQIDVPTQPTFQWYGDVDTMTWHLQLARDNTFTDIVLDVFGIDQISYTSPIVLDSGSVYYWRVTARNVCGDGITSPVFHFTTSQVHRIYLPFTLR